jgi:hypothetical protein
LPPALLLPSGHREDWDGNGCRGTLSIFGLWWFVYASTDPFMLQHVSISHRKHFGSFRSVVKPRGNGARAFVW